MMRYELVLCRNGIVRVCYWKERTNLLLIPSSLEPCIMRVRSRQMELKLQRSIVNKQ